MDEVIPVTITTKNFDVLSSGSVIIPSDEYAEFLIDGLRFRIVFSEEKDRHGHATDGHFSLNVKQDEHAEDYMEINMCNQNRSFFSSADTLIFVALLRNRKLYLKFCINSINTDDDTDLEDKLLTYTWFLEKEKH